MCDVCNGASFDEIQKKMIDTIMESGHQVLAIPDGDPPFAYSIGRALYDKPEFVVRGPLNVRVMQNMINAAAEIMDEGEDVKAGYVFPPDTLLANYPVKVVAVDPYGSEMFQSINLFGQDLIALQLVWPDMQGNFPDDPDWDARFNQPVKAI